MSDPLTLTVVLRPASGEDLPPGGPTVETLSGAAVDRDAAERVRALFVARGFEVGRLVGIAFSITAAADLARETFGDVPGTGSVPTDRLPPDIRNNVLAIEAEPPLDFGPTSFG
ncbi:MAG: hypothetical protein H0W96_04030 [Solirubrobacterales bacterium]|nr:hypothetical protein [Solirubrobacterales bacterium]